MGFGGLQSKPNTTKWRVTSRKGLFKYQMQFPKQVSDMYLEFHSQKLPVAETLPKHNNSTGGGPVSLTVMTADSFSLSFLMLRTTCSDKWQGNPKKKPQSFWHRKSSIVQQASKRKCNWCCCLTAKMGKFAMIWIPAAGEISVLFLCMGFKQGLFRSDFSCVLYTSEKKQLRQWLNDVMWGMTPLPLVYA